MSLGGMFEGSRRVTKVNALSAIWGHVQGTHVSLITDMVQVLLFVSIKQGRLSFLIAD